MNEKEALAKVNVFKITIGEPEANQEYFVKSLLSHSTVKIRMQNKYHPLKVSVTDIEPTFLEVPEPVNNSAVFSDLHKQITEKGDYKITSGIYANIIGNQIKMKLSPEHIEAVAEVLKEKERAKKVLDGIRDVLLKRLCALPFVEERQISNVVIDFDREVATADNVPLVFEVIAKAIEEADCDE